MEAMKAMKAIEAADFEPHYCPGDRHTSKLGDGLRTNNISNLKCATLAFKSDCP